MKKPGQYRDVCCIYLCKNTVGGGYDKTGSWQINQMIALHQAI